MLIPRRAGVCRRLNRVKGQAVSLMTKMEAWHSCLNTRILPSSRPTYRMSSPLAVFMEANLSTEGVVPLSVHRTRTR